MYKNFIRTISVILVLAVFALPVCSCARKSVFEEGKLRIVCTVYPVYEFTREIVQDKADVKLLVKPGSDPHSWELSTDDMMLLEEADLLVANGASMEPWLDTCLDALENKELQVCIASEGLDLITFGETINDAFEEFEGHDEDEEHEEHGHDHSVNGTDPHTWLSFDNAMSELENILNALISIDGANQAFYENNFDRVMSDIESLKAEATNDLLGMKDATIVVSHEAFGYFCKQFGMLQMPVEGISSDSEPDAMTLALIIDFVRANDIKTIYYDSIINPAAAAVISEETGCELVQLHSFGSVTGEEFSNGLSYVQAMQENINALKGMHN